MVSGILHRARGCGPPARQQAHGLALDHGGRPDGLSRRGSDDLGAACRSGGCAAPRSRRCGGAGRHGRAGPPGRRSRSGSRRVARGAEAGQTGAAAGERWARVDAVGSAAPRGPGGAAPRRVSHALCVDASVAVKWPLPEPDQQLADALLADAGACALRIVELPHLTVEVASVIQKRVHRAELSLESAQAHLRRFGVIPLQLAAPAARALQLCREFGWLSIRRVLPSRGRAAGL